jgi:hypothetical protein
MKSVKTALIILLLFSTAAIAYAGGKVVQMGITNGSAGHAVSVQKVTVSADNKTATVEIRDPDANPSGTSTVSVDIVTGEITGHTSTTTRDYTGWRVEKIWEIDSTSAEPTAGEPQVVKHRGL